MLDERRPPEGTPRVRARSTPTELLPPRGESARRPCERLRSSREPLIARPPRARSLRLRVQDESHALCSQGLVFSLRKLMPRIEQALAPFTASESTEIRE